MFVFICFAGELVSDVERMGKVCYLSEILVKLIVCDDESTSSVFVSDLVVRFVDLFC